jgi:hypothetical protein
MLRLRPCPPSLTARPRADFAQPDRFILLKPFPKLSNHGERLSVCVIEPRLTALRSSTVQQPFRPPQRLLGRRGLPAGQDHHQEGHCPEEAGPQAADRRRPRWWRSVHRQPAVRSCVRWEGNLRHLEGSARGVSVGVSVGGAGGGTAPLGVPRTHRSTLHVAAES